MSGGDSADGSEHGGAGGPYRDVGVAKVSPAEQVHQSVEAGQLAARQLLPLHHTGVFCSVQVVDGSEHPQTWTGTPSVSNHSPAGPPPDAEIAVSS